MNTPSACPSCGAALAPDATQCDLCGTSLDEAPAPEAPESRDASRGAEAAPRVASPAAAGPVSCETCEHLNPAGSRFCNRCGATLDAQHTAAPGPPQPEGGVPNPTAPAVVSAMDGGGEPEATGERPPSGPGRRALLYVGVGLAVVVGLYLATQASQRTEPAAGATTVSDQPRLTAAVPDSLGEQVARLEDEGTAQSLDQAGGLLYRAAAVFPPEDPQRAALAQRAVDLYDRSLALEDDPDVRVNLAVAALLDPRNPMRAVQELQAVLTNNPDHIEANFNMGLMRMQIGRLDAAAESFERVLALTPPGDPVHQRATEALAAIEGAMTQQGTSG